MDRWLVVMAGGALGSLARYLFVRALAERFPAQFPTGTFVVNITGSFLIGLLMSIISARPELHPNWRLFLVVGGLGGYTTFSSFEWETFSLVQGGHAVMGLGYVLSSITAGYAAVWLGAILSRLLP